MKKIAVLVFIMIFGGSNHDIFLGCLTCSEYDTDSVHNQYGSYGSKYSTSSILNQHGQYGSPYSTESPCNPHTSLNNHNPKAITDAKILWWLKYKVCDQ